jgi:hypothetical protein
VELAIAGDALSFVQAESRRMAPMKHASFNLRSIPRGWIILVLAAFSWGFVGVLLMSVRALF